MTRIMLVEDNFSVLESLSFELDMHGYEVLSAGNGEEALRLLERIPSAPDIIVSDIAMPEMDGYQLLEKIHEDPRWNGIPFIFLTAFSSPNAVRIGKELGVDDYLTKPFQVEELILSMENKLKRVRDFRKSAEQYVDNARRELLMLISHELRTPLTSIYGGAEMLSYTLEGITDENSKSMLGLINSGAKRMNHLINQILALVELDSGHFKSLLNTHSQPCDMVELVHEAWRQVENGWYRDPWQVSLVIDAPFQPVLARGLYNPLRTVLEETLRNAITYSPIDSEVAVSVTSEAGEAVIVIEDQGRGIAPHDLEHVWDRFAQINREEYEQQGAGLGLALVKGYVEQHGGSCAIESEVGRGTRVTLRLPLVR